MAISIIECATITDKIAASEDLQREHWEELATNKQLMVLNPFAERYAQLEAAGILFALVAYDEDRIIGYSVNFLHHNLHYSALLMAQNDLLFVAKAHRTGRTGLRLMQETERVAAEHGAKMMLWHAKPDTPLHKILPRLSYGVQDIIFSKEL
ncbi:MAG TPA: hypothetical protein DEQ40_05770 [Oxalobacteraceae bacterium]|nr:hypothetical protein [Oxalobacteraceae bacterium]